MVKILLAAILCLCVAQPAWAIGLDLTKIPKVRDYEASEEAFAKGTKIIREEKPYDDPLIGYEFRAGKGWSQNLQRSSLDVAGDAGHLLSDRVLGILGRYTSEPKNLLRSHITVEAQRMTYEISAQNWFVNFIVNNGFSLTSLTEHSPTALDAIYIQIENDISYVVRTRVIMNGPRLIIARYYLPQDNYEEEKVLQWQTMNSFKMIAPSKERIERQETYGFLDQSFFNFPESWTLKEKSILSIERMSALLYQEMKDDEKSVLEGHIKIDLISRLLDTTLAKEIERFRKNINIKGYTLGKMIEPVTYKYDSSIKTGKAQIYELVPADPVHQKGYEYLVAVMQGDDYYYITSMITPSREQDFYVWARNMEAIRIVNETMRRSNIKLEYDPNDPYFDYLKE